MDEGRKNLLTGIGFVAALIVVASLISQCSLPESGKRGPKPVSVADTGPVNPYCNVRKKDGSVDALPCDLAELCKNWVFFRKRIAEADAAGHKEKLKDAQKQFALTNNSLKQYDSELVTACISANGE